MKKKKIIPVFLGMLYGYPIVVEVPVKMIEDYPEKWWQDQFKDSIEATGKFTVDRYKSNLFLKELEKTKELLK